MRTATGYIRLVPHLTKQEDEIFVVFGARKPFVLRSVGEMDVEGAGKMQAYLYVGDCYVHGVIDGQLLQNTGEEGQEICLI